jgi:hypothetical protein
LRFFFVSADFLNIASKYVGYDEAKWGYDALLQQQNKNAIRWWKDAAKMPPRLPEVWFDLDIA